MRIVCWNVNSWPPTARNAATSVISSLTASTSTSTPPSTSTSSSTSSKQISAALAKWIDAVLDADVLCLQETKLSEAKLASAEIKDLAVLEGYESFWSCSGPPRTGYSGVATYCRSPKWSPTASAADEVLPAIHAFEHLPGGDAAVEALQPSTLLSAPTYLGEGRFIEVSLGPDLTLINVYAPNAGDREADGGVRAGVKAAFLRAVRRRVDELLALPKKEGAEEKEGERGSDEGDSDEGDEEGEQRRERRQRQERRRRNHGVIVCGDVNLAPSPRDVHPSIDFASLYSREEREALRALMAPPLEDAFRVLHGERSGHAGCAAGRRGFTVWDQRTAARGRDVGLRIDVFLVSDNLRVAKCDVVEGVPWSWSDHAPIVCEVEEEATGGGTGGGASALSSAAAAVVEAAPPPPPPPSSLSSSSKSPPPLLVRPPPPHEPIPQSSLKHQRWQPDRRQPTILSMFGKKRTAEGDDEAQKRAKGSGGGGG